MVSSPTLVKTTTTQSGEEHRFQNKTSHNHTEINKHHHEVSTKDHVENSKYHHDIVEGGNTVFKTKRPTVENGVISRVEQNIGGRPTGQDHIEQRKSIDKKSSKLLSSRGH